MYQTRYKCRLCGEVFTDGGTTGKRIALKAMVNIVCDGALERANNDRELSNAPALNTIHHHADGSMGLAEFMGFVHYAKENEHE